jgi:hypothetical protein
MWIVNKKICPNCRMNPFSGEFDNRPLTAEEEANARNA